MARDGSISLTFAIIFFVLYSVVWFLSLLGWRTAINRYSGKHLPSRLSTSLDSSVPGVTIIRPICGLDTGLYAALESCMTLEYPKYEVVFALQDEKDESIPLIRSITEKYSEIDARISINDTDIGINPKINNLFVPFKEAKYDLIYVIDSTVAVLPDMLGRSVEAFLTRPSSAQTPFTSQQDDVDSALLVHDQNDSSLKAGDPGLIHHVPFAVVQDTKWGSLIEEAFLNTTHAKMYLAINALAIDSCIVGKANLYSRQSVKSLMTPFRDDRRSSLSPSSSSTTQEPTGLAAFSPYLAEDNMIGLALWHQLNLKHTMTPDVVIDYLSPLTISQYINRRKRWIRVRKKMNPALASILEPFTESILSGIYGVWAIDRLIGANKSVLFGLHMVLWLVVDLSVRGALMSNLRDLKGRKSNLGLFLIGWIMREVLTLPIFVLAIWGDEVDWRGRKYRIIKNGKAVKVL